MKGQTKNNISGASSPSESLLRSAITAGRASLLPACEVVSQVPWPLLLRVRKVKFTARQVWSHPSWLPVALPPGKGSRTCPCSRSPNGARAPTWLVLTRFLLWARAPLLHPLSPLETVPPRPSICTLVFSPRLAEELV